MACSGSSAASSSTKSPAAARDRLLDDPVGPLGHDLLERAIARGVKPREMMCRVAGVLGRVLVEQDHPLHLDVVARSCRGRSG